MVRGEVNCSSGAVVNYDDQPSFRWQAVGAQELADLAQPSTCATIKAPSLPHLSMHPMSSGLAPLSISVSLSK